MDNFVLSDVIQYRHGFYRRRGNEVECWTNVPIIPAGLIPLSNAYVERYDDNTMERLGLKYRFYIRARIKGWENNIVMENDNSEN